MKRFIGVLAIIAALLGISLSIAGAIITLRVVDTAGAQIDGALSLASNSLGSISQTLTVLESTVDEMMTSLAAVEQTVSRASSALGDVAPIVATTARLGTSVADSIESFQQNLPTLAGLAGAIDLTLRALGRFGLSSYAPDAPLDQAVADIGASFDGVPLQLRQLADDTVPAETNLGSISADLGRISASVQAIGQTVSEIPQLLGEFNQNLQAIQQQVDGLRANLARALLGLKILLIVFFVWLGLSQLLPLYWGVETLRGRKAVAYDPSAAEDSHLARTQR